LAVWGASRFAGELPWLARVALADALWINIGWSLINLLPVLPFDGGNLLDQIGEIATGVHHPRWVGLVSVVVGGVGALLAASHGWTFVGFFGMFGAVRGWARWRAAPFTPSFGSILQ
jgi:Zn-dependent protease